MTHLNMDYEDFTNIIRDNPSGIAMALQSIAYQWAKGALTGEESHQDEDALHLPHFFFVQALCEALGNQVSLGGQHIPQMLREIADRAEAGQVQFVKDNFAGHPALFGGLGEVYQRWLSEGFPQPAVQMVQDPEATAQWRALLRGERDDAPFLKN